MWREMRWLRVSHWVYVRLNAVPARLPACATRDAEFGARPVGLIADAAADVAVLCSHISHDSFASVTFVLFTSPSACMDVASMTCASACSRCYVRMRRSKCRNGCFSRPRPQRNRAYCARRHQPAAPCSPPSCSLLAYASAQALAPRREASCPRERPFGAHVPKRKRRLVGRSALWVRFGFFVRFHPRWSSSRLPVGPTSMMRRTQRPAGGCSPPGTLSAARWREFGARSSRDWGSGPFRPLFPPRLHIQSAFDGALSLRSSIALCV